MALNNNFMEEVLRMAKREGDARRREKAALSNMASTNAEKLARSNAIWDTKQEREHQLKLEGSQQAGRENLAKMQQEGSIDVARINADAATRTKANAGAFTPNQLAGLRRNSLSDAREEILGMADPNGNIPNPMYLDKDGKPMAGQSQFLDQAGVQEMINRRSEELYGGFTAGLMDQGQPAQPQAPDAPVAVPEEEKLRGFTGLNGGDEDYQKDIIRSMVNAQGQTGGGFKKFSMNGAQQPVVAPPAAAPIIAPPPAAPGAMSQKIRDIVSQDQTMQSSAPAPPKSLYSKFLKPTMEGARRQVSNIKDVLSMHGSANQPNPAQAKKPFTIPTTAMTNEEIMRRRGNKPIDKALYNLYSGATRK